MEYVGILQDITPSYHNPEERYAKVKVMLNRGDPSDDLTKFKPNGNVFVRNLSRELWEQNGLVVTFDAQPVPTFDSSNPRKDAFTGENIRPFGFSIKPCEENRWNVIPPEWIPDPVLDGPEFPSRQTVFLKTTVAGCPGLVGPWTMRGAKWCPANPGNFFYFTEGSLSLEVFTHEYGAFILTAPSGGRRLDTSDAQQLCDWLRRSILKNYPEGSAAIALLDRELPQWRRELPDYLQPQHEQANTFPELEQQRFEKIKVILDSIDWRRDEWDALLASQSGQEALRAWIDKRSDEYAAEAAKLADSKQKDIWAQIARSNEEAEKAALRLKEVSDEYEKKKSAIESFSAYMRQEHERLAKDAAAWEILRSSTGKEALSVAVVTDVPESTPITWLPPELPEVMPGAETATESEFIRGRLAPCLRQWDCFCRTHDAELLHVAIAQCRCVRVPHAGWPRAYVDAMGSAARLSIVPVLPVWASFDDAWEKGVGRTWLAALEHPDLLFFLHLQDIDLSYPDAWIRPLMNILLGFSETLPVAGDPHWPKNLRLIWSAGKLNEAGREERFGIPRDMSLALPSVRATGDSESARGVGGVIEAGCVSLQTLQRWADIHRENENGYRIPEAFADYPELHGVLEKNILCMTGHYRRLTGQLRCEEGADEREALDAVLSLYDATAEE